jgi:hypothetical protein
MLIKKVNDNNNLETNELFTLTLTVLYIYGFFSNHMCQMMLGRMFVLI